MPFDAMPLGPAAPSAPLLYLHAAGRPATAEIASLRRLGLDILPFALAEEAAPAPAWRNPLALARATRLALLQHDMPARDALRHGARIAAAFRASGCGAIHVAGADAAATAGLVGASLAGAPLSISVESEEGRDLPLKLRAADIVFATGAALAARLRTLAPRAHLRTLPPAIELPAGFAPAPDGGDNGRLLCLAAMEAGSGVPALIAALALLPAERRPVVDLIGGGPLFDALRAEALEAGMSDHARFLGARPACWLAAEGARYRGFVTPDGSPPDALRAMALLLPVIAPATPGMREIVPAECGHLVPPGDAQAWARALRWLAMLPPDQRRLMGEAGRDRVLGGHTMATRAAALAQGLVLGGRVAA